MRGQVHSYRDAELTIDGIRVSSAIVTFERTESPAGLFIANPSFYECSCEMEVRSETYDAFVRALTPSIRGATPHVLARRASYGGGRKGRRAMRRLIGEGYAGIVRFNHHQWLPLPRGLVRSILDGHARVVADLNRAALEHADDLRNTVVTGRFR